MFQQDPGECARPFVSLLALVAIITFSRSRKNSIKASLLKIYRSMPSLTADGNLVWLKFQTYIRHSPRGRKYSRSGCLLESRKHQSNCPRRRSWNELGPANIESHGTLPRSDSLTSEICLYNRSLVFRKLLHAMSDAIGKLVEEDSSATHF